MNERLGPTTGSVETNGISLHYLDWHGPVRDRTPVVLLHGVLQSGAGMANLAGHLARARRVVAPDLRGRGGSDKPATGYDPATLADDVAGLIDALALDRPIIIGRLHGGLVAYHLAARYPDRVGGLVLGDTAPEVTVAQAEREITQIRALPESFPDLESAVAFYQDVLALSEARARHDIPHDLIATDGQYRWRHDLQLVEQIEAASLPRADWETIAAVSCPTLVLRGQRGVLPRSMADRYCQLMPRCRVQTVLGARHDVFLGPGCEQAFAAVDLFVLNLAQTSDSARQTSLPAAGSAATPSRAQIALPGAEVPATHDGAPALIERLVRALNSRDTAAVRDFFAPDGQITQYREHGELRQGGLETAAVAFTRVFARTPGAVVSVSDLVHEGDRAACVLTVTDTAAPRHPAHRAPTFVRVRDDKIIELTTYHLVSA